MAPVEVDEPGTANRVKPKGGKMEDQGQFQLDQIDVRPIATIANAETALKHIAVAEAAIDHWRRAKDPERLFEAVEVKLRIQAEYIVWRDATEKNKGGRGRKTGFRSETGLPDADPGKITAHRWRKRFCDKALDAVTQIVVTVIEPNKLQIALTDAQRACLRICEQENLGTVRGTEGTGEFERYTPAEFIAPVRQVLGQIDLDPATSETAQQTVQATQYFTEQDDGLAQEWLGRVFLNPPYHRDLCPKFINKLIIEIAADHVTEAILLPITAPTPNGLISRPAIAIACALPMAASIFSMSTATKCCRHTAKLSFIMARTGQNSSGCSTVISAAQSDAACGQFPNWQRIMTDQAAGGIKGRRRTPDPRPLER
jgi:hypothetical protein